MELDAEPSSTDSLQTVASGPYSVPSQQLTQTPTKGWRSFRSVHSNRWAALIGVSAIGIVLLIGLAAWAALRLSHNTGQMSSAVGSYPTIGVPASKLPSLGVDQLKLKSANQVAINGQLQVSNGIVLKPMVKPSTAVIGELYYDQTTNQVVYYNGSQYISIGAQAAAPVINNITNITNVQSQAGGATLTGGNGVRISGASIDNTGVLAINGASGSFTTGSGLAVNNNVLSSTVNISSKVPNLTVVADGDGGFTIASQNDGSFVQLGPSTAQTDNTTNSSIFINKTAAGNLLQLQNNGASVLTVGNTGNTTLQPATDSATTLVVKNAAGTTTILAIDSTLPAVTLNATLAITGNSTFNGSATVKATSTTAFQVQNASGSTTLGVDTTNGRVGVGTATPTNQLSINTLTTADASARVAISTLAIGNKGLVVQGITGQTADLLQAQTSTGAVMASIGATGNALFKNNVDSTTAFQIQDSAGTALLGADTTKSTLSVGQYFATVVWTTAPVTRTDYPIASNANPTSVTSADFNGDGKADLAVANNSLTTISIFINNGTGTFAPKVDYPAGTSPSSVTSADFNGDGKADLAVANNASSSVSVFIGTGTGTFAPKVDYPAGSSPSSVTSADFNGDGKADLAVANGTSGSGIVSVFINNGTGTFAPKVDYPGSFQPKSVTSADFNGDGKADLVTVDTTFSNFSIYINTGTGTFAPKVDYPAGSSPSSVTSADFNGDGKADLAVANNASSSVSVFIGTGTGTFAPKVDYPAGSGPTSVTSTDFNGDGKADLAVANGTFGSSNASVFINNGNGSFAAKVDYPTGDIPRSIISSDFNADGKADLAIVNTGSDNLSVLLFGATTGTAVVQDPSKFVVNATALTVGQTIQGAGGQAADLLQVKDNINNKLFSIGATGNALFKNNVDSTTAFQVQNASGSTTLGVDTTNGRVGVGTATPTNQLSINTLTTADASARVAISTLAIGNKGLVVQGITGQTADLLQAQTSTGAVMASIGATGNVTFKNSLNSATAFRIQDASGTINYLTLDTASPLLSVAAPTSISGTLGVKATSTTAFQVQNASGSTTSLTVDTSAGLITANAATTIASNKSFTANGSALFKAATVSTTAFQIQNATGSSILSVDTAGAIVTVSGAASISGNLTLGGIFTANANVRGIGVAVPAAATVKAISFGAAYPDANYAVVCTPNYNTSCFVTSKTTTGFTINFGVSAPGDGSGTVDWVVLH